MQKGKTYTKLTPLRTAILVVLLGLFCFLAFTLIGKGNKEDSVNTTPTAVDAVGSTQDSDYYFRDGTLKLQDAKVVITDTKVIPVGEKGNEYGTKPIIAFWFKTTNLTGREMTPGDAWIACVNAFQDNNPNAENQLEVSALPDDRFRDSQFENIKKGGTVEEAIGYELDDMFTPVVLRAVATANGQKLGEQTFIIKP